MEYFCDYKWKYIVVEIGEQRCPFYLFSDTAGDINTNSTFTFTPKKLDFNYDFQFFIE